MSWSQAVEILKQIVANMKNNAEGTAWLERLEQVGCKDAPRLGYCIAIDVASGALTVEKYAEILDTVNISEKCSRRAFAQTVAAAKSEAVKCASCLIVASEDERYVQVLPLGNFISFYKKNRTLSPDDVNATWVEHFSDLAPRDLAGIKEIWRGLAGVIWITSTEDFERLSAGLTGDELATVLNDSLGLGKDPTSLTEKQRKDGVHDQNELVGFFYPPGFTGARPPTALDAGWMDFGSYYVSGGSSGGWGLTVSCSGTHAPARERVHREYKESMAGFESFPIGHITERTTNRTTLLEIANRRLESILSPGAT